MSTNIVGDNIRKIREEMKITQEELALMSDLSQPYINFLESGKRGYSRSSLQKIVDALEINISELFINDKDSSKILEPSPVYGKSKRDYSEIIKLLDKLPDNSIDHYKVILQAEAEIMEKSKKQK